MNKQLSHNEYQHQIIKHKITLVLDNLEHLENIGSAFRLADAFCVTKIIILDDKQLFLDDNAKKNFKAINKTARNCMNYVEYEIMSTSYFLNKINEDSNVVALEITSESKDIREEQFYKNEPLFLIVGNEKNGVSDKLLQVCSKTVHINMYGNNSSLNVASAISIALYEITNQLNK